MSFEIADRILDLNPRVVKISGKKAKGPTVPNWPDVETRAEDWVKANRGCLSFESAGSFRYGIVLDSDMIVVDVDCHDGQEDGWESLEGLFEATGVRLEDETSLLVRSPSGGAHLFFKKPPERFEALST